ncbi:MAG TPA: TonB-dependent receptor [Gemmatimonadales bacterium]|nr:TonB-dependent receptor [Gemmatimonadales bacterium]
MNVALLVLALAVPQQDTVVLKPVVVTATRLPVPADVVASAVTVLRGADLEAEGIRTAAEALETVPGAHIAETGGFGGQTSLFLRGGESDYTKILVDGVPLNQAGGAIDLAHLTTDNVDRIEIVHGPVSVLYGSDAVTGVVQIFTRSGRGRAQMGAELRAGTYGSTDGALDVTGGTAVVGYSARVSQFSSDGLYTYNSQYRNTVASGRITYKPDARTAASLTYRYGDDRYHFPTDFTGAPSDSNQRSAERGPLLSLSAGRAWGEHLEVRINTALKEARLFYNDEPDSPGQSGTFWSRDYLRRSTTSALTTWRPRPKISVISGLEYEDERQRGTSEYSDSFGSFPNPPVHVQRYNVGYLTQALIQVGPTALTLGGRWDDNSQFGGHGTYRVGLVYTLTDGTRLKLSTGTGFKEPTFFENFAQGFVRGNPHLKPERSFSWEVGAERGPLVVTYFDQRFRDLIAYSSTLLLPDSVNYANVGAALATGIEAKLGADLTSQVRFSVSYTFLHTRVQKADSTDPVFVMGKPLIRRPAHTVAPQLFATIGRASVTVGALWVGKRDDIGLQRVTMSPYTRVNLAAEYPLRHVTLSARVDNLFNDQHQEINGYRPLGRVVMLGGRLRVGR